MNTELRKDCPMRHEFGNCLPAGGFCTAVNDPICEALHNAYDTGRRAAFIQARQEAEKNEPLTIEELKQMNGEPVWVKELSELIDQTGWALVEVDDRGAYKGIPYVKCHICTWDVSFRGLHCYRHKPKE